MGVDLNRNYGFHYAAAQEDQDQCGETFRGPFAFSEPETQAVKALVVGEPEITSAMNFHTYGNMWVHPFSYQTEEGKYPDHFDPTLLNFYEQFKKEVMKVSRSDYGTTIETVHYASNGEASDWMLGEHNIVAFSPELGSFNPQAQDFIIPKNLIVDVINENYKVIELFLKRNEFKLSDLTFGFDNKKRLSIQFENSGLANIYDPVFELESEGEGFPEAVSRITVISRAGERVEAKIDKIDDKRILRFTFPKLLRFHEFRMYFYFKDPAIEARPFDVRLTMKLNSGYVFNVSKLVYNGKVVNFNTLFTLLSIIIVCLLAFVGLLTNQYFDKTTPGETNDVENPVIREPEQIVPQDMLQANLT